MKKTLVLMSLAALFAACSESNPPRPQNGAAKPPVAAAPEAAKPSAPAPEAAKSAPTPSEPAKPSAPETDSQKPVAEINGVPVSEAELNEKVAPQIDKIKAQILDAQLQGINGLVQDKLLEIEAKKRNVTVQELLKTEIQDKTPAPTDAEIQAFYTANQARLQGKSLEEVKPMIANQLQSQKASQARNKFMADLKAQNKVRIFLKRPKVEVSADDDPVKGNPNAPVTIIAFSDYQCPFCSRADATVHEVLKLYGDKVKFVMRDFPLSFHNNAPKAAEAADCAGEQQKYWEYGELLWKNQKALEVPNLKKYAGELKLDQAKFDQCLDSGKFKAEVDKDIADGVKVGVSGTPAFFINGQMLTGARPVDAFKEIIDAELADLQN